MLLRNTTLDLSTPVLMGILNVTPDSFSDGGKYNRFEAAVKRVEELIKQGASIIDIGGESTRPGADPVSEEEELDRVVPLVEHIISRFSDIIISVDTTKYDVAKQSLESGAQIINDISGLRFEPRLADLCAQYRAALIIMHSVGNPKTMQVNPDYENVLDDVFDFLHQQIIYARSVGVEHIIADPGIGFGKTLQHNIDLIKGLKSYEKLGVPIMVGASRKSMIGKILGEVPANERVIGTVAVHYECLLRGASILRVHDVKESSDSLRIFNAINGTAK